MKGQLVSFKPDTKSYQLKLFTFKIEKNIKSMFLNFKIKFRQGLSFLT